MALRLGSISTDELKVDTVVPIERVQTVAATGLQPHFVRNAGAWLEVEAAAVDVDRVADLARRRDEFAPVPSLEKLWAEAVHEGVRRRAFPCAPSRLACLFATEPGYHGALELAPELGLTS